MKEQVTIWIVVNSFMLLPWWPRVTYNHYIGEKGILVLQLVIVAMIVGIARVTKTAVALTYTASTAETVNLVISKSAEVL